MPNDAIPSFAAMLRGALGDLLAPEAVTFVDMFDEAGVMEFPFAPQDGVTRIEGRQALSEYLSGLGKMVDIDSMSAPVVHRTADPHTVVLEFDSVARGVVTGGTYQQSYISVIKVAKGRIVHYRDYWNPLVVMRLIQDAEAASSAQARGKLDGR